MSSTTRKTIAVVDADGILYAAALRGETMVDGRQLQLLDISKVYRDTLSRIEDQVKLAQADDAFIILSDRVGHRTALLPSYKANRSAMPRPLLLDQLRNLISDEAPYTTMLIKGLEADDVCGIAAGSLNRAGRRAIVVSPDKDLLQIPGEVLTIHRDKSGMTGTLATITEESADRWHIYQTLVGDTVDNYKGCPGMGPARAGTFLDDCAYAELTPGERWEEVVTLFRNAGKSEAEALVQARVARILRVDDWDAVNKEVRLWQPPID